MNTFFQNMKEGVIFDKNILNAMSQYNTLQSITTRLKELGDHLSSSKLSQEQLEEFETLSRKLYEITVILNYKAKEEVYKKKAVPKEEPVVPKKEPVQEPKENLSTNESNEPATPKPHGLVEFDFSGDPNSDKESTEGTKGSVEYQVTQDKVDSEKEKQTKEESITTESIPKEDVTLFYQHFSTTYKEALKDKLNNSKVDSIKNAIGLNEKLQFIGELFEGNSDMFNQTVEELDQLENNEIALKKLSEIAAQKRWDKEAELVDLFANIVTRRYVE